MTILGILGRSKKEEIFCLQDKLLDSIESTDPTPVDERQTGAKHRFCPPRVEGDAKAIQSEFGPRCTNREAS
jgi:hypothetical protein